MITQEKISYAKFCTSCGQPTDNLSSFRFGASDCFGVITGGILISLCDGCKQEL